jgi:hypothetical protein
MHLPPLKAVYSDSPRTLLLALLPQLAYSVNLLLFLLQLVDCSVLQLLLLHLRNHNKLNRQLVFLVNLLLLLPNRLAECLAIYQNPLLLPLPPLPVPFHLELHLLLQMLPLLVR